jgi:predicted ATP-grasp superfamily ATP-dependent carboligase
VYSGATPEAILDRVAVAGAGGRAWLIATSDAWLRFIARYRPQLEQRFESILHPRNEILKICLGKGAFADWCVARGLPTPRRFDEVRALAEPARLPFPLLVRPVESEHASVRVPKAVEAHDPVELERWIGVFRAEGRAPLVTESLLGRRITQYSVGAARRGTALMTFVAVKQRPLPEMCSVGTFVELRPDDAVERLAREALESLDYEGIAEVEILRDEQSGRDYLIEINARHWVQNGLGPASGHDPLAFLLDPSTVDYRRAMKSGKRWLNLSTDLYGSFSRSLGVVRKGGLPVGSWLLSILRANTYAHFSWTDPVPAWRDIVRVAGDFARARRH